MEPTITRKEFGNRYERGRMQTVKFLISRGLREEEAKEKAQAAWAKGWERRYQIKNKKKTLAWINTIALNLYRSSFPRDSRYLSFREHPTSPKVDIAAFDLHRKLDQCRDIEKEILELRYFAGFNIKDLAKRYGCAESAMRVRLLRARRSLRAKYLPKSEKEPGAGKLKSAKEILH